MNAKEEKNAWMSEDGKHRLVLWRIWDKKLPMISFIGLNPSNANALKDDPTIRRVRKFAKQWGYGGFYMLNLFTKITSNPSNLLQDANISMTSDYYIRFYTNRSDEVLFCWGSFKAAKSRSLEIINMFPLATALHINKDGSPKHPLYVKGDIKRILFNSKTIDN